MSSSCLTPVSILTHLYFNSPLSSYRPATAKIMKKNIRIMMVSLSKGIAVNKAVTSTLSPSILCIVLRGLKTLKARSPPKETLLVLYVSTFLIIFKLSRLLASG